MIEKYLIRFCATEVQTMIARLHERPEDFDFGSRWRDLIQARDGFNWAERMVLDKEWAKHKKNEKRRALLHMITKQVVDPDPTRDWTRGLNTTSAVLYQNAQLRAQMDAQQNSAQQAMNGYQDPRSIYYQGNSNV